MGVAWDRIMRSMDMQLQCWWAMDWEEESTRGVWDNVIKMYVTQRAVY